MNDIFENQIILYLTKISNELDLEILPMPNLKYTNKENKNTKFY